MMVAMLDEAERAESGSETAPKSPTQAAPGVPGAEQKPETPSKSEIKVAPSKSK
jgi:hypothetical protein